MAFAAMNHFKMISFQVHCKAWPESGQFFCPHFELVGHVVEKMFLSYCYCPGGIKGKLA